MQCFFVQGQLICHICISLWLQRIKCVFDNSVNSFPWNRIMCRNCCCRLIFVLFCVINMDVDIQSAVGCLSNADRFSSKIVAIVDQCKCNSVNHSVWTSCTTIGIYKFVSFVLCFNVFLFLRKHVQWI